MPVVNNTEAKKFHFLDMIQQTLAGPETGLKTFEVWLMTLKPGGESPLYHHLGETVWVILKGSGRALVDGEEVQVGADTCLSIPAGASRQLFNTGDDELVMLTIRGMIAPEQAGHGGKPLAL